MIGSTRSVSVFAYGQPVDMRRIQPAFVERGVWLRPFGRLVYTMPPFVMETDDVRRVTDAIQSVVGAYA